MMLAKSRGCVSFAFGLLLFTGAAWAQFVAIEGDVKGPDGQLVKGAEILIVREDMKGTFKGAKTDKKGHYIYNGLPIGGRFTVSVSIDGEKRDQVEHVSPHLGDPTPVNFDLKQKQVDAQALQKAAETGTMTKEMERSLTKEQKEALEKRAKENQATMAKNKALNDSFNAGKEAMLAKNYDAAIDAFKKGTEMDPSQTVIWAQLADAYAAQATTKTGADQQAALENAANAYQKCIALKPDDSAVHNNYGLVLARQKKLDEAQVELNKAAELDPPNAGKYYYNLGALLTNTGQIDAATVAFKKAIDANPNYPDAQFQYATALSGKLTTTADGKVNAPPGMKEALEKYLELAPTGPYAEAAKSMLQMIGATIQTDYTNPNAKKPVKKK